MSKVDNDDELETRFSGSLFWTGNVKPFKGACSGVLETALRYDGEAYLTVPTVRSGQNICVRYAPQKSSPKA